MALVDDPRPVDIELVDDPVDTELVDNPVDTELVDDPVRWWQVKAGKQLSVNRIIYQFSVNNDNNYMMCEGNNDEKFPSL